VPQPTQRIGFPTQDLGRSHVSMQTSVQYAFCPPTSGEHFNVTGQAPLRRAFYGPDAGLRPGNWIHNLEHGYVVFAYRDTPDQATLDQIRQAMDNAPAGPLSAACQVPNKVIAVRFDDMSTPFAVLAWDRALLMDQWDSEQAMKFAAQWQDSPQAPEQIC
jgi:hypothetical protein